ncbi:MAG TPA: formate dehydrogenase accessory sulfurtransferase FdhD [Caulobacteraceae bacterium]|jgi:FdhD protein
MMLKTAVPVCCARWSAGRASGEADRVLPEETPVALVHDGATTAVVMATPADLEDFGVGFSLAEGIIEAPADLRAVEVAQESLGVEVRMWLGPMAGARLAARRRFLAGPSGYGLAGADSLEEAIRRTPPAGPAPFSVDADELRRALEALADARPLGEATHAVDAAGFWLEGELTLREDVGRETALDKLIGARAQAEPAEGGVLLVTGRMGVRMVQKAAVLGAPVICARAAPTALAVRLADAAGLTLAAASTDGFEVFTHPDRVRHEEPERRAPRLRLAADADAP